MAIIEENLFLPVLNQSFTYFLSDDLDEVKNAFLSRTGITIENIDESEWSENIGLAQEVRNLMKTNNCSYCFTSWLEDGFQHFVINHFIDGNYYIYSGMAMNGWIIKKLIEPNYLELTDDILKTLSMKEVIYAEYAELGAKGNAGGIMVYIILNDKLICYEANGFKTLLTYNNTIDILTNSSNKFRNNENINKKWIFKYYDGGYGNNVFINKEKSIKPFGDYFLFLHGKYYYRICSSVQGVFNSVVYAIEKGGNGV